MPKPPYEIVFKDCKKCHVSYNPNNQDEDAQHSKHHRGLAEVFNPKALTTTPSNVIMNVEPGSSKWKHRQMYYRAMAMANETKRLHVPWSYGINIEGTIYKETDPHRHGSLITGPNGLIVGGICFHFYFWQRSYRNMEPSLLTGYWSLEWVWIAPKFRKRGYLAKHWPELRGWYGDFHIEKPTENMRDYLTRRGDEHLLAL